MENRSNTFIESRNNHEHIRLEKSYRRFQMAISNCSHTSFVKQPSDVCIRGRKCFQTEYNYRRIHILSVPRKFIKSKSVRPVSCPCPRTKPFACGSYCSLNKKACDFFNLKKNSNSSYLTKGNQILRIKKCEGNFNRI